MTRTDDLKIMVEATYDNIAPYFAETRRTVWPPTKMFIDGVAPCTLGDLGCGTGRSLIEAASRGCQVIGIDSSKGQLEIAMEQVRAAGHMKKVRLVKGDLENIPLDDEELDATILIAALHHLPDRDSRIQALSEVFRCTKPGGKFQVSVWTWNQDRFRELHLSRIDGKREPGELDGPLPGDFMVPWKKGAYQKRFYHLYGPGELEDEIDSSHWTLLRSYFDERNHWAECIKGP